MGVAQRGNPFEQYALGQKYLIGDRVPQDHVEAYKWHNLVGAFGYQRASEARKLARQKLVASKEAAGKFKEVLGKK